MKKISIISFGSRGDIQPYLAVALALRDAGYDVRFLCSIDHVPFIERHGFEINPIYPPLEEPMKTNPKYRAIMEKGDTATFLKAFKKYFEEHQESIFQKFIQEMHSSRPDLLVGGTGSEYPTQYASYFMRIPSVQVKVFHVTWAKGRAVLGYPTLPLGLHYHMFKRILVPAMYKSMKQLEEAAVSHRGNDKRLAEIVPLKKFTWEMEHPDAPIIVCASSLTKDILHREADPDLHRFVGACVIESSTQLSDSSAFGANEQLNQFLKADPSRKPVYCGWGSMICRSPEYMVKLAVRALQISGERGIILGGWAMLTQKLLEASTKDVELIQYARENILFVEKAPHEWLFPRVACTVHHGGAGTLASAMRSGSPTIITPVFLDQYDNAHVVSQIGNGIGFKKQFQMISAKELGAAINRVVKEGAYSEKAEQVKAHTLAEMGSAGAIIEIERFWKEYVESGWYEAKIKAALHQAGYDNDGNPPPRDKTTRKKLRMRSLFFRGHTKSQGSA